MSDEDEQFQQRWGFRRNDSDVDSSSNEQSRPSSVSEQKPKRNTATRLFTNKDDQKTMHSPQSHPGDENHSSDDEFDKESNKSCKKQGRKSTTRRTDRQASDHEPFNGASIDLSQHMESLVEDVKVARQGLLKWMNDELEKSFKDDKISQPAVPKKNPRQGTKRSTTPRNNPNKARRRSGTNTRNPEGRSSDKLVKESKTSHETSEVIVSGNDPAENGASGTIPAEKNQKPKGKRLGVSSKKQKIAAADQQTDKAGDKAPASASASNYLTLPAVLPRQEPENSERTNSEGGVGERDMRLRNGLMNQPINLSSQLNYTPRSQQKDGIFSQNYPRNVSDYEQIGTPTIGNIRGTGNGNGGVFPFALQSQGLNGGIGMPNFPGQFGLQYLSQESILSGLRMNGGHPILQNGNHAFSESYGAYNQQLRYKAQGGLMPSHSPDNIRAGNLQQPR
ncbi:uncharacterized protein LOC141639586 [Silene latifolia]|uniref:uncharacterized protein LOC141639586 n=1 Tax=Silene latifolia TaxID=37657 RepID=UPI003D76E6F0